MVGLPIFLVMIVSSYVTREFLSEKDNQSLVTCMNQDNGDNILVFQNGKLVAEFGQAESENDNGDPYLACATKACADFFKIRSARIIDNAKGRTSHVELKGWKGTFQFNYRHAYETHCEKMGKPFPPLEGPPKRGKSGMKKTYKPWKEILSASV